MSMTAVLVLCFACATFGAALGVMVMGAIVCGALADERSYDRERG